MKKSERLLNVIADMLYNTALELTAHVIGRDVHGGVRCLDLSCDEKNEVSLRALIYLDSVFCDADADVRLTSSEFDIVMARVRFELLRINDDDSAD